MGTNWANALARPSSITLKQYVSQLLKERYNQETDDLMDRVAVGLITKSDMESFGKFVVSIYEAAYTKCLEDHRAALERAGHRAIVKPGGVVDSKPIFPS